MWMWSVHVCVWGGGVLVGVYGGVSMSVEERVKRNKGIVWLWGLPYSQLGQTLTVE